MTFIRQQLTQEQIKAYDDQHGCGFMNAKKALEKPLREAEHEQVINDVKAAKTVEDLKEALLYILYRSRP